MRSVRLFRHGESEVNAAFGAIIGGRSGWCELTGAGIAQSRALGAALAGAGLRADRVVASSTVRAQQTARYCLETLGRPELPLRRIEVAPALAELSQGDWENEPRAQIYTPETLARIERTHPWYFRPPGGESQDDLFRRVHGWLVREVLARPERYVWLFCHGLVIKVLLTGLFGWDRRNAWKIPIDNASMTWITHDPGAPGAEIGRAHV